MEEFDEYLGFEGIEETDPEVTLEAELKQSKDKIQKLSFNQLTERLGKVVNHMEKFCKRVSKKTEHSTFLENITDGFQLDIIENLGNLRVVTDEDIVEALM